MNAGQKKRRLQKHKHFQLAKYPIRPKDHYGRFMILLVRNAQNFFVARERVSKLRRYWLKHYGY